MIDIVFSQHYRKLILKYGLVFGGLSQQLEDARKARGPVCISAEAVEWEQVVGDLSFAINRGGLSTSLMFEINEIAEEIEFELRQA